MQYIYQDLFKKNQLIRLALKIVSSIMFGGRLSWFVPTGGLRNAKR
jgi:hypothetical protein